MKYGDTLRQRSIPEWGHYNIDYDYLKDLIKHQTTPGAGKALSIPGQGSTTEKAFGDTFFKVLKAQHDRINLFIRSKSGEIERRLEFIGKQLEQLQAGRSSEFTDTRLPARTVEKYAKIDADITKAGEEIRSLSRFRVAQRTGFHKILKKYKRWTKDRELEHRFKSEVTSSPASFFQLDLGYLLDQYIDVLGAIRAPLDDSGASSPFPEPNHRSVTSRLSRAIGEGSEVDFDAALTSIPLGSRGSRAVYWIHPDHIVEVEVLLLQHMRLHSSSNTRTTTPKDSSNATPLRRKSSATVDKYLGNEDDVGLIILDHPETFALKQNSSTIGSSEETPGALATKAEGSARWTSSDDVAVVFGLSSQQPSHASDQLSIAKLKRKQLQALLDAEDRLSAQANGNEEETTQENTSMIQKWLVEHNDPRPIAGICSKRTRFVGLHNTFSGGLWASLDRDIFMNSSVHKSLGSDDWFSEARTDSTAFPHAVLEIRREGSHSMGLIQHLDRSHLVERVRGFTLEAHAVWLCCKPQTMSPPMWLSTLDADIRKLPAPVKRKSRKAYSRSESASQISPPQTSTSATSATSPWASRNETSATSASEFPEAPPLRAFKKKPRRSYQEYVPTAQPVPPTQRYWNEYDNPESEEEGYYIYVDPNASVNFPGQEWMEAWARKAKKFLRLGKLSEDESPLLSAAEDGTSDDDTADESPTDVVKSYGAIPSDPNSRPREGYFSGIFRSWRDPHRDAEALNIMRQHSELERRELLSEIQIRQHEREMAKFQLYASCLVAAAVLDIILSILTNASRRKARGEVDSAIILGVICNLLLLLVAVVNMRARQERLSLFHQGFVIFVVIAMVAVDALLFRWALNL